MSLSLDLLSVLQTIPVFKGLEAEHFETLIPTLKAQTYLQWSDIINEGEEGNALFILKSGKVRVFKTSEKISNDGSIDRNEIFLAELEAGAYFGEFSLLDEMPRSATVRALEICEVYILEKSIFDPLLEKHPQLATRFYRNCLTETFNRHRNIASNFTFSQQTLRDKTAELEELHGDLYTAKRIQDYFVNTEAQSQKLSPSLHGLKLSSSYQPCQEIGGDLIDFLECQQGSLAFLIADVAGHGVTGALATGVLKSSFSIYAKDFGEQPAKVLSQMNRHFGSMLQDLFATAYAGSIDPKAKTLTLSKAGHPPPYFYQKRTETFYPFNLKGTCLGFSPTSTFMEVTLPFEPGDKLLLFTDGILEQNNPEGKMFDELGLEMSFKKAINKQSPQILKDIIADLRHFSRGAKVEDDTTLFLIEF